MKPIRFLGDSLKRLREFPEDARQDAGYQLAKVQAREQPDDFKPMPSIGKGVEEIRIWDESGTYRVIDTARQKDCVSFASVWDALADTPEEAANLRARSELMRQIAASVKDSNWTQTEAAQRGGVTQPRMNDLLRGRVSRFSLDALVNIATAMGREVRVELQAT